MYGFTEKTDDDNYTLCLLQLDFYPKASWSTLQHLDLQGGRRLFSPLEKNLCQKYRSHSGFTVTSTDCTKESSILNLWALFDETKCRALHKKSSWGMSSIHGVMGHLTCSLFGATLWFWLTISKRCACSDIAKLASVWTFP